MRRSNLVGLKFGAIWLRRIGDKAQVLVERDGKWHLAIEEILRRLFQPKGITT